MKEIRRALLDADVHFNIAKEFTERVKQEALGQNVIKSISPGQLMVKVMNQELVTQLMRNNLLSYCIGQWEGYRPAPHHRVIARALEAVERGEIKRLMISVPPRHGKSQLTSEFFPAWYLGRNPDKYIITSTYSQELAEDFGRNPVASLVTVRCSPWQVGGKVALIGDAAHAIVPFYGQGANASFEDVSSLVDCLARHGNDIGSALKAYEGERIANANAIADMALHNFIEMRDRTASRLFRAKKRVEHALHATLGDRFIPLYDMVSFTNVPYAQAKARGARQDRMLVAGAAAACIVALGVAAGAAAWLLGS